MELRGCIPGGSRRVTDQSSSTDIRECCTRFLNTCWFDPLHRRGRDPHSRACWWNCETLARSKRTRLVKNIVLVGCYHSRLPDPLPFMKCELHLMLATRDSQL